jgi:lysophospholipase L1-like esterase
MLIPMLTTISRRVLFLAAVLALITPIGAVEHGILVRSGEKIGFMGDSITAQADAPDGYIGLVIFALQVEGIIATPIPAGVPGHTSGNMRARVDPQIFGPGANWMTLSCGVNDVLMQKNGRGIELEDYKKNVVFMVEAALAKHVRVVLMTPTPLGEDLGNAENAQLAGYVAFVRSYASEKGLPLADVNTLFHEALKAGTPTEPDAPEGKHLLADGVHPNKTGQALMAKAVLLALGVPAADLPRIEQAQFDNPLGKGVKISGREIVLISPRQYAALVQLAGGRSATATAHIETLWKQALTTAGAGAEPTPEQKTVAQATFGTLVTAFLAKGGN